MTSPEPPEERRRATDGLDWSQPPRPAWYERSEPFAAGESDVQPAPPPPVQEEAPRAPAPAAPRGGGGGGGWLARTAGVAAASALLGGLVGGILVWAATSDDDAGASRGAFATTAARGTPATTPLGTGFAAVINTARQSVVKIESTRRTARGVEQDVGSGVVIDNQGHIVTNAHVIVGTESLKVILPDGTEQPGIVIGHDAPFNDVAVLQVGPGKVQPMPVGDSSALVPGETVAAIGNPLSEFAGTVTVGVVSGLNRGRTVDGVRMTDYIQTDAAVNNGNSGGALINDSGQFVGMPTLVLRDAPNSAAVEGIAFAIPSARVIAIAQQIIQANGPLARPTLGLDHTDLTPDTAARVGRSGVTAGALVTAVAPNGPAAAAGIQAGDVITKLGDGDVTPDNPLLNRLMPLEPGQTVHVVLNRGGRIIEVDVRLAKRA